MFYNHTPGPLWEANLVIFAFLATKNHIYGAQKKRPPPGTTVVGIVPWNAVPELLHAHVWPWTVSAGHVMVLMFWTSWCGEGVHLKWDHDVLMEQPPSPVSGRSNVPACHS